MKANHIVQRTAVIAEAQSWLETPWHHAACVKGAGVDCGWFIYAVFLECGLIAPTAIDTYPRDWALHNTEERYLEVVERYAQRIESPQAGDIVVFKNGNTFSHGAIVVDYPRLIHAQVGCGVCYADAGCGKLAGRDAVYYSVFGASV
jgi:NlpC/P60 family putative phage cell wall peptidase